MCCCFVNFRKMKKRHEQKLIVLTISLVLMFNLPLIVNFDNNGQFYGVPLSYLFMFSVWLGSIVISYVILNRYYE
jgi:hypothetical protein